jgi:hypothetical protein
MLRVLFPRKSVGREETKEIIEQEARGSWRQDAKI